MTAIDQALTQAIVADKHRALKAATVSRETEARLDAYVDLLVQWQQKTNLIAPSTLPQLWTRHIADSLQLLTLAPTARRWIDLGSGGGFPGVVLACALADQPGTAIHLVERNAKKAAFLREALRVTGAPGVVHLGSIEDIVDKLVEPFDCVTARALAPLKVLLDMTEPLLAKGTTALFMKGQDVEAELTEAAKCWIIEPKLHASISGGNGWIIEITKLQNRPDGARRNV